MSVETSALSPDHPAPAVAGSPGRTVAVVGGHVVPVTGPPVPGGTVLVRDGKIVAVGADVEVPEDADVVDATGRWVLPGFVEVHSHVGIWEEGEGTEGDDVNEMTGPDQSAVRAIDGINVDDEGFRDALVGGITAMVVKPGSGNPIGGQAVALKSWGGRTVDEQVIVETVSIKSALGENPKRVYGQKKQTPSTRLGTARVIREAFLRAQHHRAQREAAEAKGEPFARDLGLEALGRVLDGELVWDQHCHRHDDIVTALRLAEEFGYRLVVNHGTEAHKIADVLAEKGVPVVYGPMFTSRVKVELRDRAIAHLARLVEAGVQVAITTDHPVVPINFLVHQATLAVKEGLPRDVAIEALTINPARIMGLEDRVGALEPGLDGDVVVWSGDPLDVASRAEHVLIDGRTVYRWDDEARVGRVVERAERFAR